MSSLPPPHLSYTHRILAPCLSQVRSAIQDVKSQHQTTRQAGFATLMLLLLRMQSTFFSPQHQPPDFEVFIDWFVAKEISTEPLFDALSYFLHPDQSTALSQLCQQFPRDDSRPQPLYKQYSIPAEILPQLFPNLDTTQISPRYDWLIYLLAQFTPSTRETYQEQLTSHFQSHIESCKSFSISDTFVHNRLFNSYDEYLEFKLPQLGLQTPTSAAADAGPGDNPDPNTTSPSFSSPVFSFFPNQHPFLPTIASKNEYAACTATLGYKFYYLWSFLFGTSLLTQHRPEFYTALNYGKFLALFDRSLMQFNTAFEYQLSAYRYRMYLQSIDSQHFRDHLKTGRNTTPPTFINQYFPLQFTFLSYTSLSAATILSPSFISDAGVIGSMMHYHYPWIYLMYVLFCQCKVNPLDSYLFSTIQAYSRRYSYYDTMKIWTDPDNSYQQQRLNSFVELFVLRSYDFYLQGKNTLHQYLYHQMMLNVIDAKEHLAPLSNFFQILILPFVRYPSTSTIIQKHITLCLDAGFLNPLPPAQSTALSSLSTLNTTTHIADLTTHLTQLLPTIHRLLIYFRAFTYSYLVMLVNFEVYFPIPSHLLLDCIPTLSLSENLPPSRLQDSERIPNASSLINSMPLEYLVNPLKSNPQVTHALVDAYGNIYALECQPQGRHSGAKKEANVEVIDDNPFLDEELLSYKADPVVEPCPYSRSMLLPEQQARIASPANQISRKPTPLERDYARYHQELLGIESKLVVEQIRKVLNVAHSAGLFDANASTQSYPFPQPIIFPTPDHLTTQEARQISNWALEMLIVACFQLQPFQPIKQPSLPGSLDFHNINAVPPLSQQAILDSSFYDQNQFTSARDHVLSTFSSTLPQILQYQPHALPAQHSLQPQQHPNLTTKHEYLFDALFEAILSPALKLIHALWLLGDQNDTP